MNQLQTSINSSAAAAQKQSFSFQGVAQGLQTLVGGYLVATRVIGAFGQVINQGNELEKTLITFRVLSGSAEQYEKNLALAKAQQDRFGGSLQDTVEGMSNFANLSRRTGIEIDKLTNLARAMAVIDPAQGFKGAGIALKEFFSGDITSLARRFEIPRDALNGIKNIADEGERFEALQQVLAQYGITTELLGAQANSTAVIYDKLVGSAADFGAGIGQLLGTILAPFAQKLGEDLKKSVDQVNTAKNNIDALLNQGDQLGAINSKIFANTDGYCCIFFSWREICM